MKIFVILFVAVTCVIIISCSPLKTLNILSGASEARTEKDLAYGPHPRQKLDRYSGDESSSGSPVCHIIFVYGGSWEDGSKGEYGFVGSELAKSGYLVSIPDYRLYPDVTYPEFVNDIALSISHEVEYAAGKNRPVVLMGHSAGALIAGLISYNPKYLRSVGLDPSLVAAFVSVAGPHDKFLPTEKTRWTNIFGKDKHEQLQALPVNHVQASAPPTLILHGEDDEIVTPESAKSLHQALTEKNVMSVIKMYPGVGHKRIVAAIGSPLQNLAPTLEDINSFLGELGCSNEKNDRFIL